MVVLACVVAIFQYEESPVMRVAWNNNSRFIILSMITRKSPGFESQLLMQPTLGLKRVDRDLALFTIISLYSGFDCNRLALPKLQYIIKPKSCVVVLNCSFFSGSSMRIASLYKTVSRVCSYRYNKLPGKNPLHHHPEPLTSSRPALSCHVLGKR